MDAAKNNNGKKKVISLAILVVIIVTTVLSPIAVNRCLLKPAIRPVVGTNVDWLVFWGSYLSSLISALIAFTILLVQRRDNHNENEQNRQLQINVLRYQQEMQLLNENRDILIDSVLASNKDHLVEIAHKLEGKQDILFDVKTTLNHLMKCDSKVGFMQIPFKSEEYNTFNVKRASAYINFRDAILDLQEINILFQQTDFGIRYAILNDRLKQGYIHQGLKSVISQYTNEQDFLRLQAGEVSAMLLSVIPDLFEDTRNAALAYIKSEEKRISKLLTSE